ncbi:MAG: glycerol-3-phosphate dehydrogenase C-terminal domain-containing protein, partial [Cyclobacteriaceae bacterium]
SELSYTIDKEMTCSSVDFFMRRTGRLYFDIQSVLKYKEQVLQDLSLALGWDSEALERDRVRLQDAIDDARQFLKP